MKTITLTAKQMIDVADFARIVTPQHVVDANPTLGVKAVVRMERVSDTINELPGLKALRDGHKAFNDRATEEQKKLQDSQTNPLSPEQTTDLVKKLREECGIDALEGAEVVAELADDKFDCLKATFEGHGHEYFRQGGPLVVVAKALGIDE